MEWGRAKQAPRGVGNVFWCEHNKKCAEKYYLCNAINRMIEYNDTHIKRL